MARSLTTSDLKALEDRLTALDEAAVKVARRGTRNMLQINSLKDRLSVMEGLFPGLDTDDYVLRTEFELLEASVAALEARVGANEDELVRIVDLIDPLFRDPVNWYGDFDMHGNDVDLAGGELQSRVGFVRFQPHWDDLRTPATSARAAGSKIPSWIQLQNNGAGSTGVYAWFFPGSVERELQFQVQMPHAWVEGTEIEPHVHWSANDGSAGTVVWKLEYTVASIGGAIGTTTTISAPGAAPGTAKIHQIAGFEPDISMEGETLSAMLWCRIYRDVADPDDTYPLGAWFHEIDFHFQLDGLGSNQTLSKSTAAVEVPPGGTLPGGGGGSGKDPIPGE